MNIEKTRLADQNWENEGGSVNSTSAITSASKNAKELRILRRFIALSSIGLWGRGLYFRQKRRIVFDAGRNKLATLRNLRIKIKNLLSLNKINNDILNQGSSDILRKNKVYDVYSIDKLKTPVGYISQGHYYEFNEENGDPLGSIGNDGALRFFPRNFGIHKLESAVIKNGILTRNSDGIQYSIKERVSQ